MDKIPVCALIDDFQLMEREQWSYGSDTQRGAVDCSGAFVWAYDQHGHDIYHGSNRMARVEVDKLMPIEGAKIVPGMAAFKCRLPGVAYYALPSSYLPGGRHHNGDLGDYYHVGLVDDDIRRVLNARSTADGFVASPITQGWTHVGYLKQVDYGETKEDPMSEIKMATVTAESGSTVNLRKAPDGDLFDRVPVGSVVPVSGHQGGWSRVSYAGTVGWMMDKYLDFGNGPIEATPDEDVVTITMPRETAEKLRDILAGAVGWG